MFEKHTIYSVVSIPSFLSNPTEVVPKIEGWFAHEFQATERVEKISAWKSSAVIKHQADLNDLIRLLNEGVEE